MDNCNKLINKYLVTIGGWNQYSSSQCILIVSLVLASYLYTVYRLFQIKRENSVLIQTIATRTQSFESTLNELKESSGRMANQIRFISILLASISHDIQSPLRYVSLTASGIPDLLRTGQIDKTVQLGQIISDVSKTTSNLMEAMVDYIKIQIYGNTVKAETIFLRELIESKVKFFKAAAELTGTHISIKCSPETTVDSDYHLLSIILHNLLDNACKYTRRGLIVIDAHANQEGKTEINISNTGLGLSTKAVELINQDAGDSSEATPPREKRIFGLGLFIVKELVRFLNIKINVSQEDKTHFKLVFNGRYETDNS